VTVRCIASRTATPAHLLVGTFCQRRGIAFGDASQGHTRLSSDRATGRAQALGFGSSCSGFQGIFETPGPAVAGSPGVSRGSSVLYALRRNLGERGAPNVRHRERTPERR